MKMWMQFNVMPRTYDAWRKSRAKRGVGGHLESVTNQIRWQAAYDPWDIQPLCSCTKELKLIY